METGRSRGGGAAVSKRGGARAGVCRRQEQAGALAADMDSHCECAAETPAAEPPSGKINKAAFKLFKKRKSGGTMPSIFGVKNKGDGKSAGPAGMVRSRTHDGLAEVLVLEGSKKEEPPGGGDHGGARPSTVPPKAAGPGLGSLASSSVAKSHSFFSLLKKNGRSETGKGDPAEASKAGGKQKRGLKGIFSSMRWHRRDKRGKEEEEKAARAAGPGSLVLPGSLTASLECVKEEPPRAARRPDSSGQDAPRHAAGCGDIIADPEEEAGPSCDKHAPGPGKPVLSKKNPNVVAYQGGGEEMASPDEVDDTYLPEFWDMLSQSEDQGQGPQEGAAKAATASDTKLAPETSADARCGEVDKDVSSVKRRRLHRIPMESQQKEEPKQPEKEHQEGGVPNSDEGYWDSSTPGPEEESASSSKKVAIARDSDSGDALYDLYAEPEGSPAPLPATEDPPCLSRLKPVSPGTITCPLRTPGSLLKDSKIPISIKHLSNIPSSHPVVHQQPTRSEMPRTKIPVSKVLVRRVSNRGLAGTTIRAAACHDSAKKL
ncbi:APC membrane recruitment protein 2 isoform X3 [Meriones unguiculatus]|uniref:APC membrane recruitment protein 2 isoform X3 n=1 Tax=Meriones unguiculatus TaxID=10047 RepID=UPI00293E42D8|nr:APC membrane recruitment protein 2 isoform X3 [Meriones unguiculatus]